MKNPVTIIMYHFVRNLKNSEYPSIKGLDLQLFEEQINYLLKHYHFIRLEELQQALYSEGKTLPPNSVLLTFDDGYVDHYTNVFPLLRQLKIQGCFFPPGKAVLENSVLDVNKIHFILASIKDPEPIVSHILDRISCFRSEYNLQDPQCYYKKYAVENRFDDKKVNFIKRVLQKDLTLELRKIIVDQLFQDYVTKDERSFARDLYLSIEQLQEMNESGMYIGGHGYDHFWYDTLDEIEQEREVDLTVNFLQKIGTPVSNWAMCYPYGAYNKSLIEILQSKGCSLGFSTEVKLGNLGDDDPMTLPRLDTNDLPKDQNAEPNKWTKAVI